MVFDGHHQKLTESIRSTKLGFEERFFMNKWIKLLKNNTNLAYCTWKYLWTPWMSMILPLGYNFNQDPAWNTRKTPDEGSVPHLLNLQNHTTNEIFLQMKRIRYILHLLRNIQCTTIRIKNSLKTKWFLLYRNKHLITEGLGLPTYSINLQAIESRM